MMYQAFFDAPIGRLFLQASDTALTRVGFVEPQDEEPPIHRNGILDMGCIQFAEYFAGQRMQFELPVAQVATPFQQQVWQLLTTIPFGATLSYQALSKLYGDEKAIRAIAAANGKNNIAIIVPCHRVVGSNGDLTGFAWGIERKRWLLEHEAAISGKTVQSRLF